MTAVRFPLWPERHGYGFVEFARRHGDFAIVSAAALLTEDAAGKITRASVTLGGMGVAPVRATRSREGADRPIAGRQAAARGLRNLPQVRGDRRHPRAGLLSPASRDGDVAPRARSRRERGSRAAPSIEIERTPMAETRKDHADGQRQALRSRGRGAADARRFPAPHARPDRHASRLRARRLRRLHHPARRA